MLRVLCLLALLGSRGALAFKPEPRDLEDAKRFSLDKVHPSRSESPGSRERARFALEAFNRGSRPRLSGGFSLAASGSSSARRKDARTLAEAFLAQNKDWLKVDPAELNLELLRSAGGLHHLFFSQVHEGVPVEFSSVRIHFNDAGEALSFQSSYRPGITESPVPALSEAAAARIVAADLGPGSSPPVGGRLVYFPLPDSGELRLAWKFRLAGAGGHWVYYVDARTGALLLRYDDLRHVAGTVMGQVYGIDPTTTPGPSTLGLAHENVYVCGPSTATVTLANGLGTYSVPGIATCNTITSLQGPFVNAASFNGPNAHFDDGVGSAWYTFGSAVSSPHPYPDSSILVSTINFVGPSACGGPVQKMLAHFSAFNVGGADSFGNITDDDQVAVLGPDGNAVATYVGSPPVPFRSAAVPGTQLRLRLTSDSSGNAFGFNVDISSYLCIPPQAGFAGANVVWYATMTFDNKLDEVNVFYHVNQMHDYFANGVDANGAAAIGFPIPAMVQVGPNLSNAFYDPFQIYLAFGNGGNDVIALDATVIHHEYTHFVVDQLFPIAQFANFGQAGALSEAWADYFSASSLNDSSIGKYAGAGFGEGTLRQLDCSANPPCIAFPGQWQGEVHQDSRMVSQALWEIRQTPTAGQACADNLAFQAIQFFPDGFQSFLQAVLDVSANSGPPNNLAPACGANHSQDGTIIARFFAHGIVQSPSDQDVYEPNDSIQTATVLTTAPVISARIFPAADLDWYTFGAGPGLITATLTLPANPLFSGAYFDYGLTLVDRNYSTVATAFPHPDINGTPSGNCPESGNCMTSARQVTLSYNNPSANQFFLLVSGGLSDFGSPSNVNSTAFYSLQTSYNQTGPIGANIINASFDNDTISYAVLVSSFARKQNYNFYAAQFHDQSLAVLPQTLTSQPGSYLASVAANGAYGVISGQLHLQPGFAGRFPAVGTVYLEIFGQNVLGTVESLGLSSAINLSTNESELSAWNNVFNPNQGQKATFKYEIQQPGNVTLRLYTMNGQPVATLLDGFQPAGKGSIDWGGTNSNGRTVASGIYLLHLSGPGIERTQKVVVVK